METRPEDARETAGRRVNGANLRRGADSCAANPAERGGRISADADAGVPNPLAETEFRTRAIPSRAARTGRSAEDAGTPKAPRADLAYGAAFLRETKREAETAA